MKQLFIQKKAIKRFFMLLWLCGGAFLADAQSFLDYSKYHIVFDEEFNYPCVSCNVGNSIRPSHDLGLSVSTSGIGVVGNIFDSTWKTTTDPDGEWPGANADMYFVPQQVSLPNPGILRITENKVLPFATPVRGRTVDHISGYLKTRHKKASYGIIEARMKFPTNNLPYIDYNYQPASVALWTTGGEIDIVDIATGTYMPQRLIDWSIWDLTPLYPKYKCAKTVNFFRNPPHQLFSTGDTHIDAITDLASDFHNYTCEWTPHEVKYYLDDVFLWSCPYDTVRTYDTSYALEFFLTAHSAYTDNSFRTDGSGNLVLDAMGNKIFDSIHHHHETKDGEFVDIDWIRIWEPNCAQTDLNVSEITGLSNRIPPGMHSYKTITSGPTASSIVNKTQAQTATIFKAEATTLNPQFLADESTSFTTSFLCTFTHYNSSDDSIQTMYDKPANGFFEILPISCEDHSCPPILGDDEICFGSPMNLFYNWDPSLTFPYWTSSNPLVASIAPVGAITQHAPGTTTFTVHQGECTVSKTVTFTDCGSYEELQNVAPDTTQNVGTSVYGNSDSVKHLDPQKTSGPTKNAIQSAIEIHPNPAQNNITITYPCVTSGQLAITIKDVAGREMHSESVSCNEGNSVRHDVDISTFSPGVYFVDLTLNEQHVVKKIVKL